MENEKQAENFKIAISSTIKALAKKQDLNILFSDTPAKESNVINLPKSPNILIFIYRIKTNLGKVNNINFFSRCV